MKSLKLNSYVLLITVMLLCIPSFLYARAEERIEEAHPLDRDGKVYLENVSGDIIVKTWEKNEVKILARKVAKNEESLDKVFFDVNQTNNNIRIKTRHKKTWGLFKSVNASIHYDLLIPDKAQLRVKSVSGSVEALNIGGSVDIETVSGRIELVEAGRGAKCKSISGALHLEEITGDTSVSSTSGKIRVDGVKGSVEAHSISGSVVLQEISLAEEIKAETISGRIKMQGELSPGGNYEFKTISGGIRLDLPSKSDFELEANTTSGAVRCDFELKVSGKISRKKIQGVVGEGGSSLKISSLSGGITIE